jgi:hypothetical protein
MGTRRKFRSASIGLFFFQDIVFLATGIFILVSVCFALSTRLDQISIERHDESDQEMGDLIRNLARLNEERRLNEFLNHWHEAGQQPAEAIKDVKFPPLRDGSIQLPGISSDAVLASITSPRDLAEANAGLRTRFDEFRGRIAPPAIELSILEKEYQRIRDAMLALEEKRNRILIHPGEERSLTEPLFVLLGGDALSLEWLDRPDLTRHLSQPFTSARLARAFSPFSPEQQLILIMVRPSGAAEFSRIRNYLDNEGFLIGYEPVSESFDLNFELKNRVLDIVW